MLNENLYYSTDVKSILRIMSERGNNIASILYYGYNDYLTNSEVNFLELSNNLNMIRYYPSKKVDTKISYYDKFIQSTTEARIGRVIRKILDSYGFNKKTKYVGKCKLFSSNTTTNSLTILFENISNVNFAFFGENVQVNSIIDLNISNKEYNSKFELSSNFNSKTDKIFFTFNMGNVNIEETTNNIHTTPLYNNDYIGGNVYFMSVSNKIYKELINLEYCHKINYFNRNRLYSDNSSDSISIADIQLDCNYELEYKLEMKITDRDIEEFVNLYQSLVQINFGEKSVELKLVKGKDIPYWYDYDNYFNKIGQLGNSCMSDVPDSFFKIYEKNDCVSMLILLDKDTNKLLARALIWKLSSNSYNDSEYFMDRVYSIKDSYIDILNDYAIKNNYLYRESRLSSEFKYNGQSISGDITLEVILDKTNFEYYPYLDTLQYMYSNTLTNKYRPYSSGYTLNDTDGSKYRV